MTLQHTQQPAERARACRRVSLQPVSRLNSSVVAALSLVRLGALIIDYGKFYSMGYLESLSVLAAHAQLLTRQFSLKLRLFCVIE